MYALISPNEPRQTGYRVAWVNAEQVPQAEPLFWIQCDNSIVADLYWYDPIDKRIKQVPAYIPSIEENKATAIQLLTETDWVNQPDVINPAITPHLLNQSEFIAYRSLVRAIAINPIAGNIEWPIKPTEEWSS